MTEQEARRIIDEARSFCPKFIRGGYCYSVGPTGRVTILRAIGKSGKRWELGPTVAADNWQIPPDVRARLS